MTKPSSNLCQLCLLESHHRFAGRRRTDSQVGRPRGIYPCLAWASLGFEQLSVSLAANGRTAFSNGRIKRNACLSLYSTRHRSHAAEKKRPNVQIQRPPKAVRWNAGLGIRSPRQHRTAHSPPLPLSPFEEFHSARIKIRKLMAKFDLKRYSPSCLMIVVVGRCPPTRPRVLGVEDFEKGTCFRCGVRKPSLQDLGHLACDRLNSCFVVRF